MALILITYITNEPPLYAKTLLQHTLLHDVSLHVVITTPPSGSGRMVVEKSGVREGDTNSDGVNASHGQRTGRNSRTDEWLRDQAEQVGANVCDKMVQISLSEPK